MVQLLEHYFVSRACRTGASPTHAPTFANEQRSWRYLDIIDDRQNRSRSHRVILPAFPRCWYESGRCGLHKDARPATSGGRSGNRLHPIITVARQLLNLLPLQRIATT